MNGWLWEHLQETKKPIVLYGMGNGADKILAVCGEKNIPVAGVFASDGFCRGHKYRGFRVTSYAEAKAAFGELVVLVSFGTGRADVLENIERIAAEQELYAPDVPVYGGGLFDREHRSRHEEDYNRVFDMLEDEQSRQTFKDLLEYRKSGKIEHLKDCELPEAEAFNTILQLGENETYLDGGAYTGDTVQRFLSRVNSYNRIIAVEPDTKNYVKLAQNTAMLKNIQLVQVCLHSESGEIPFAQRAGRHASAQEGTRTMQAQTIDNILQGAAATFIKLDVEGQEAEAILGAQDTISRHKPKLQIAAYHRTDDLFAIPLLVKKIRPDYRVYLRHNPCIPAWDTVYYFV